MDQNHRINNSGRKHSKQAGSTEDDYSTSVRKKLNSSTRTGQACDRCKVRKIKCDGAVEGCSPCRQTQATCKTTDRITGKATVRGLTDILEGENRFLKAQLREYQKKLRDLGIQVEDVQVASPTYVSPTTEGDPQQWDSRQNSGTSNRQGSLRNSSETNQEDGSFFQRHLANETGSLSHNPGFSMLRGTKLSLFGMQIDLAEFADDSNDINSPETFEGYIETMFNRSAPVQAPPLPPNLQAAKEYMTWYFRFLSPYTPVIDKRDTYALLTSFYENPTPGPRKGRTAAEEVLVHMLLAHIKYQYGQRNQMQSMLDEALAHFQYSLRFYPDLEKSQTLQDVQAMVLIAIQVRGFPKPGAAWYCSQLAMATAIEIGLNRSAAAWSALEPRKITPHETQMRKRVFWTLYGIVVGLSGRLGRPIPLRLSDIDIEFPEPMHDNLPEESNGPEFRLCSYHVGIAINKILALSGELYSTFYSAAGCLPQNYDANVARFESDLQSWKSSVHPEIQESARAAGEYHIYALYLELYAYEFQFLLYHPLILPSGDPERFKDHLQKCRELVPKPLAVLRALRDANCMDVPWYTVTTFLAMIFTTLFTEDQRQGDITETQLQTLKVEMDVWLSILHDIGNVLGSGSRLQDSVGQIIRNVLDTLNKRVSAKAAAAVAAEALGQSQRTASVAEAYNNTNGFNNSANTPAITAGDIKPEVHSAYPPPAQALPTAQSPYPPAVVGAAQYPVYQDTAATTHAPYQNNPYAQQQAVPVPPPTLPTAPLYAPAPGVQYFPAQDPQNTPANEWLRWSQAHLTAYAQGPPQEYLTSSASTLMTLGARTATMQNGTQSDAAMNEPTSQWPMNVFNLGQHGQHSVNPPG